MCCTLPPSLPLPLPLSPSPLAELTQQELDVIPVTQSTYMQKNKLKFLLGKVDQLLRNNTRSTIKDKKKTVSIAQYIHLHYFCGLKL
jgi:hypothetical protein